MVNSNEEERAINLIPNLDDATIVKLRTRLILSKGYFEFGIGGSTVLAAECATPIVIGIESDVNWIEAVSLACEKTGSSSILKLIRADVGATKKWGYPQEPRPGLGREYAVVPFLSLDSVDLRVIDTVFIDGRYRVASAIASAFFCLMLNSSELTITNQGRTIGPLMRSLVRGHAVGVRGGSISRVPETS
jgi:hypothetical protein